MQTRQTFPNQYLIHLKVLEEGELFVIQTENGPIGPRLSKRDPLPDWPLYFTTREDSKVWEIKWFNWINSQNIKLKKLTYKKRR